jgi:RNA polymerase sigma-70 factor (ECF subfamily)
VNEAEQIVRAQRGDGAAWVMLVSQHQQAVFRLAYLLLGDPDEAQDVAQQVFIRAFRYLHRFDPARPLRPWLLRITRNLAYNRQRSLRRYLAALSRWWHDPSTKENLDRSDGFSESLSEQTVQGLWLAIQQLSAGDQEIIYLRYFLELSVLESAATLGVAEGTAKSRLSRALRRLRTVIEQHFPNLRSDQGHEEGTA